MSIENVLTQNKFNLLNELVESITDGKHGGVTLTSEGVLFLRNINIKPGLIDLTEKRYISVEESSETKRAELDEDDILLTTIGTLIGDAVRIPKGFPHATINQNLVKIRLKDRNKAAFISSFFNSKYGKGQIYRIAVGNIWYLVNYPNLKTVQVPIFSDNLYFQFKSLTVVQARLLDQSKLVYKKAENLLLQALGLENFTPSQEAVNIKSFSASFGSSGRLDAEYYQVKYEQVVERIKSTNYDKLVNLVNIKKSIEPGSANYAEEGFPFMRVSDYNKFGFSTPDKYLTSEFCKEKADEIKKLKPKKETILFSKDGSVGTAYMLRNDEEFITSSAILHLKVKDKTKIIPEYLTLALNSKLVQMQAERDAGGSIILHWRVGEIENVVVPVINFTKQREIADLIEDSFALKKQSEHLLEVAKQAVEMAIEKSEAEAMTFIEMETN